MKRFSQLGVSVSDKGQRFGEVVLAHGGLEVCERLMLWLALSRPPLGEEADDQASEHSQDPQGIGATNSAAIFIKRYIQALVGSVLDSPSHAIGCEPV